MTVSGALYLRAKATVIAWSVTLLVGILFTMAEYSIPGTLFDSVYKLDNAITSALLGVCYVLSLLTFLQFLKDRRAPV